MKLTYCNETKQFSTDTTSEFGCSFIAWCVFGLGFLSAVLDLLTTKGSRMFG